MIQQTIFPFKLEMTTEKLTAHGGLAFIAEYNHGLGLRELVDMYLPAPGSNRGFKPSIYIYALVLMLEAGGRSLEDLRELEEERELMRLIGQERVPCADTTGDWLRRMGVDPKGLEGLDKVRTIVTQRILKRDGIENYTLDVDATEVTGEKAAAQYTYKGNKGYMPMLGFLYESGLCMYDEFREGNVSPASGHKGFYEKCKERMVEGKKIGYYRADSASYQANLINELEKDGVVWGITADLDKAVKALIASMNEEEWKEPIKGCGYQVAETVHSMDKTENAFRLIVKRQAKQGELYEENGDTYKYHAIGTNWPQEEKDAYGVIKWHNERGNAENFNKELKIGFGMERMPCGQTSANAVFFRIGVIAYNLFIGFKRQSCPSQWHSHVIGTFRWKMIQIAGRIISHAGSVILKLAVDATKLTLLKKIRRKNYEMFLCADG